MLWDHSKKGKQKHTSFWWKPLRTNHKMPHSFTLIVFLHENELFQRGWGVFVTLVEIPEGWGGHQFPAKMENPGGWGGPKWDSLHGEGLNIFWNYTFPETYSILSTLSEQIVHTWLCFGSNIKSLYTATPLTNFTPISASIGHLNVVYCKHLSTLGDFHPINFSWGLCIGIQFFWQCNVV